MREDIQQDLGLYGNMMVEPENEAYYSPVNREEVLILDDILIDEIGIDSLGRPISNPCTHGPIWKCIARKR